MHTASIAGLAGGMMAVLLHQQEVYNLTTMMAINSILLLSIGLVSLSRLYYSYGQILAGIATGFSDVYHCF